MSDFHEFMNRYTERHAGMNLARLRTLTTQEADEEISKKVGKKLRVSPPGDDRLIGRGSVLLNRLSYTEDIDREISKI